MFPGMVIASVIIVDNAQPIIVKYDSILYIFGWSQFICKDIRGFYT